MTSNQFARVDQKMFQNNHSKIKCEDVMGDIERAVGIWLGVREDSGEMCAGTEEGVVRANSFRRKAGEEKRWNDEVRKLNGILNMKRVEKVIRRTHGARR